MTLKNIRLFGKLGFIAAIALIVFGGLNENSETINTGFALIVTSGAAIVIGGLNR